MNECCHPFSSVITSLQISSQAEIIFHLISAACWGGIALACMDVAKKHVTRKAHADVDMRVCDYPTIQVCKTA